MRIPDPIANTTTEAYLAYKAGVLSEGDLKPKLYDPYIHLDAWLAYWAGLTTTYPVKGVGKNLFDKDNTTDGYRLGANGEPYADAPYTLSWYIPVKPNTTYTISFGSVLSTPSYTNIASYGSDKTFIYRWIPAQVGSYTLTTQADAQYLRVATPLNRKGTTQCELGSTATAYEPYSGEPEMLTDEEALIAYLSGVTNTYPEEFRDPADVRVAAYLKYLVSARWGRPEYPVTNEELYLSMMDAPYIPAGEPSSDIEIDDTAEAPFKDVKMYGDTSQTTYTGKNLFNLVTPATNNGVTVTANADGSFTLNGTTTGVVIFNFILPALKPAGTYTISCTSKNQVMDGGFFIRARNQNMGMLVPGGADGPSQIKGDGTNYAEKTFISTDPMYCLALNLTTTGVTYNNMIIYPQVEVGGTATDWERYVGGVPAPNPDYPQAVNTVTGRQVVKVEGKNLLSIEDYSATGAGVSVSISDNVISLNGKTTADWGFNIKGGNNAFTLPLEAGSYSVSLNKAVNFPIKLNIKKYDGYTLALAEIPAGSLSTTVTISEQAVYYTLWSDTALGTDIDVSNFGVQLEKGSEATDFEPYQGQSYEVNLGKNLFDKDNANVLNAYFALPRDTTITSNAQNRTLYVPCDANTTYTFQAMGSNWIRQVGYTSTTPAAGVSVSGITNLEKNATSITITTGSTAKYLVFRFWHQNNSTETYQQALDSIQIEKGSQATSYAAYFTPIELCKIGTYQDYIYENDGKWKIHKATGKAVLVGTEPIVLGGTSTTGKYRFNITVSGVANVASTDKASYSDNFISATRNETYACTQGMSLAQDLVQIYCEETATYSLDQFRAWLASHNTTAYYPLATATDTEITNTALIDQLNALKNGGSYTGTTYIKVSATDPNLPGLLKVEAYKYD